MQEHTICSCNVFGDTTSQVFNLGKGVTLNRVKTRTHFHEQAEVFHQPPGVTYKDDTIAVGEKALIHLYTGMEDDLDILKCTRDSARKLPPVQSIVNCPFCHNSTAFK